MDAERQIDLNSMGATTAAFDGVFNQLPMILHNGCKALTDETEKSVFMLSAIGVLSGIMPNVYGIYNGRTVYPNLYFWLIGKYGSGKGTMDFARQIAEPIHRQKLEETKQAKQDAAELEFKKAVPQQLLYIPANNSQSGFFELLHQNTGTGIMFESEADTLTDALRTDFGKYSDGLRKLFHHERYSFYRRQNQEFVNIESGRLSVVISGTTDQLFKLIPTSENGLFSRFCYYNLPDTSEFVNVFDPNKNDYQKTFDQLGDYGFRLYNLLSQADPLTAYVFRFSESQQDQFLEYFRTLKAEIRENISHDLDGLIHRFGLQYFKIAMILSVLRKLSTKLDHEIICTDQDFELTKAIFEPLKQTAIEIYLSMPAPAVNDHAITEKARHYEQALELHNLGKSYAEIANTIFGTDTKKSTIFRWINY